MQSTKRRQKMNNAMTGDEDGDEQNGHFLDWNPGERVLDPRRPLGGEKRSAGHGKQKQIP